MHFLATVPNRLQLDSCPHRHPQCGDQLDSCAGQLDSCAHWHNAAVPNLTPALTASECTSWSVTAHGCSVSSHRDRSPHMAVQWPHAVIGDPTWLFGTTCSDWWPHTVMCDCTRWLWIRFVWIVDLSEAGGMTVKHGFQKRIWCTSVSP